MDPHGVPFPPALLAGLNSGEAYLNIHTTVVPTAPPRSPQAGLLCHWRFLTFHPTGRGVPPLAGQPFPVGRQMVYTARIVGMRTNGAVSMAMKCFCRLAPVAFLFAILMALIGAGANAAGPADLRVERASNRGVVQLVTGGSAGASIRIAEDLAAIFDDGATRRILPVVGRGALKNLSDLTSLRGIDMAILQADVLDGVRQQRGMPGIENSFTYITKLYNEELHILARADVGSIADLARRKVNVDVPGSGTVVTTGRVFELLGIPIDAVYDTQEMALEKLRRGEIAAMAFVAGKPASLFRGLRQDDGLHFVEVPLNPSVLNAYVPTSLTSADYPALIGADAKIDTVAVGTLLAVANLATDSDRYKNVIVFVDIFFTEFRSLLEPGRHPKWREINLAAELPGWRRFPPAQQWLDRNRAVARQDQPDVKALFGRFLDTRKQVLGSTPLTEQQKKELFDQFEHWQAGHAR